MHFSGSLDYKVCAKFAQVVDNIIKYFTQIHFDFQNYNQGQKAECKKSLQNNLDRLRIDWGYDFGGIAMYERSLRSSPIKWKYVSGNTNERYKLIILKQAKHYHSKTTKYEVNISPQNTK